MKIYLKLLSFSKKYSLRLFVSFVAAIFFAIFNSIAIWMVGTLISTILKENVETVTDPITFASKIESYISTYFIKGTTQIDKLGQVCIYLFLAYIIKNIFFYINQTMLSYVQLNIIKDIRNKLYKKIQYLPLKFFDKKRSGELLSILLHDISSIRIAFTKSFQTFLSEFINISILLLMLFVLSPKITLIILVTIPIAGFITVKIGQSIRRKAKRSSYKIADISNIIQENIYGIKIVKAFNMKLKEINRFMNENLNFNNLLYRQEKLYNLTTPVNDLIGVSIAVGLLWFGGNEVLGKSPSLSPDNFMKYIIFLFALLQPARKLGSSIAAIQTGIASANRVYSILNIPLDKADGEIDIKAFNDSIEFKNVNFKYDNSDSYALKNINFKFKKGQTIALVGKSGSGKTTFTNLLLRFYDPTNGTIIIDDFDVKSISKSSLRNITSVVTQEPILFNDSISNNISYGLDNKNIDDIKNAAKIANIDEKINLLTNQYDTIVGEKGARMSGGEKQRLSIARAVLRDPAILILDEATSSLDSESEKLVQNAINNLIKDRTVFVIAHRLSTIKDADIILVFDNGEIVESGDHNTLMKLKNHYFSLYNNQFELNYE